MTNVLNCVSKGKKKIERGKRYRKMTFELEFLM